MAEISGFCCCNNGTTQTYAIGPTNPCDAFCSEAGVQANVSYDPTSYTPNCTDITTPAGEATDADACGGMCVGTDVCNPVTGACEGPDATTDDTTGDDATTDDTTDATGDAAGGPGGAPGAADPGPAVSMINFSGLNSIQDLFARIVAFIMPLALLFAGVMIIWSGFLFVTAQGDPTKITTAKKNFVWTVSGVAIILASSAIVDYISGLIGGTSTGAGEALKTRIENALMNQIIPLLFVLVTVYFFWGIITYVRAAGDQKAIDTGKQHMIWGIIGMAVMASAWGIVAVIKSMVQ